ncbi:TolC family protein [Asticcacaulis sp. ZE23SCel15]|uniref:TolC family protein n=1 Tax=Asticcacaulis sp. ZE23SCel15 TaxID=3059027 RepID=UPI00265F354A|nr:TolC family protein [Asticcacaulis sp. ZE23SCel15]WKL57457.1 TolC family protein [Asticcacaulis sp. ZE23SCel15]
MIFSKRHRFGVLMASGRVAGLTLPAVLCAGLCLSAMAQAETLPLSVAMSRAAQSDPAAMATQKRLAATEAGIRQAGVRPNPSVGLEAENVLGSGPYSGLSQAETTLSYQQPLERKSKREARIWAASAEKDLARAEGRVRTWEAMTAAQRLWVEAVVAEAETELAGQRLKLAEQSQAEIRRRVTAARDPLFAGSLAETEVATARIAHDQAAAKVRQLKTQLAALWGGAAEFELEAKWLEDTPVISEPTLLETPDIEVLRARQRLSAAQVRVETTRRVQDATVSAGIRHFQGDGAVAFIIGGSIPLNRNDAYRGHIDRARADSEAASADIEVAERYRQRDITAATLRMADLAHEAERIKSEVIPQAETALRQVREGFVRGGFTYRDVIGTQQTLMTAKARRLEVLKQFHIEQINRDRLSGKWLALLPDVEAAQ